MSYQALTQDEDSYIHDNVVSARIPENSVVFIRPPTYYNDGPFSPPSSVDGDEETLLDKDLTSDSGIEHNIKHRGSTSKRDKVRYLINHFYSSTAHYKSLCLGIKRYLRYLILCISGLVSLAVIIALFPLFFSTDNSVQRSGLRHIALDNIYDGTFAMEKRTLNWVSEGMFNKRLSSQVLFFPCVY